MKARARASIRQHLVVSVSLAQQAKTLFGSGRCILKLSEQMGDRALKIWSMSLLLAFCLFQYSRFDTLWFLLSYAQSTMYRRRETKLVRVANLYVEDGELSEQSALARSSRAEGVRGTTEKIRENKII